MSSRCVAGSDFLRLMSDSVRALLVAHLPRGLFGKYKESRDLFISARCQTSIAALGWKEVHSPDSSQRLKEMSASVALEKG